MRIGIVDLYCGQSGKEGYYNSQEIGLAKAFAHLGNDCIIFKPDIEGHITQEERVTENVLLVSVPAKNLGVHSRFSWKILLKYQLDMVQINSDNQIFAPELSRFCKQHKIRQYHYLGTTGSDAATGMKAGIMKLLYKRNIAMLKRVPCFAKTQSVKNRLKSIGIEKIELAPVGLDLAVIPDVENDKDQLRKQLHLQQNRRLILYVGRMEAYKHPLEAVDLMKTLPENYDMVMIGTGTMDNLVKEKIETYGFTQRVKRICQVPNQEIHKYYRAADYFVNFNPNEIFGMSILEAMWQGCTVIAYHAPGPDFILKDKNVGYLIDNLTDMRNVLVKNEKVNSKYEREYIKTQFTWEKTAEIILKGMEA